MSQDDPLKKYWEKRAQELPHYKPAHETQGIKPSNTSFSQYSQPAPFNTSNRDIDISAQLRQRISQKGIESQFQAAGERRYDLVEGYKYYTVLKSENFGHTFIIAKTGGIIGGNSSKGVIVKEERRCIIVDEINVLDFSKINENSKEIVTLVEISVPLVGTFLVKKEAISNFNRNTIGLGNGRQLLKG